MSHLDYLLAVGGLPEGTEPIFDLDRIYGVSVLMLEDRAIRIDILRMAFNWRVVETVMPHGMTYERYWCYSTRTHTLDDVAELVREWGGAEDGEPQGWIKATGERRPSEGSTES